MSRLCGSEVGSLEAELGRRLLASPRKGKGAWTRWGFNYRRRSKRIHLEGRRGEIDRQEISHRARVHEGEDRETRSSPDHHVHDHHQHYYQTMYSVLRAPYTVHRILIGERLHDGQGDGQDQMFIVSPVPPYTVSGATLRPVYSVDLR